MFKNSIPREFKMKLFWLFGQLSLADSSQESSSELYPIADPISIVSKPISGRLPVQKDIKTENSN